MIAERERMIVERERPGVLRVTADVHELATLVTAARWVAEGRQEHIPVQALREVRRVVGEYDRGLAKMREKAARAV
jgi:hypothetical protein